MNELMSFDFGGNAVRTVTVDGDVWFVAKDVANILGYADASMMYRRLDDDEKLTRQINCTGQNRDMITINESGLYNAIIGSEKQEAKAFKKWVTSEVLPAIRKSGGYMVTIENEDPAETVKRAMQILNDTIERNKRSIDQGYRSVIGRKDSIISKAKDELDVKREKDIVPAIKDLKEQIGACKEYATILAVQRFFPKGKFNWKDLKTYSINCELDVKDVPDPRYGSVKAYPKEAWLHLYGVDLEELF